MSICISETEVKQEKDIYISWIYGNKMEILRVCVGGGGGGGNKCNRAYWGTLKHKKTNFHFWGGTSLSLFQGNKGTGTPTPREGFIP